VTLAIVSAVLGFLVVAGAAYAIPRLLDDSDGGADAAPTGPGRAMSLRAMASPETGKKLTVQTPEGFTYSIQAVGGGVDAEASSSPPPEGMAFAYVDYVFTNTGNEPALLDFPPDVFLKRSIVPDDEQERCIPRVGAPESVCAAPSKPKVIGRLDDSPPPYTIDTGDTYMPAKGSYLVRAVAEFPIPADASGDDLSLYVWAVRFTEDRIAKHAPFPE
jgi:hypothetical protein